MGEPLGPSANEVKHHFLEDGERILSIDDASLAGASPPPAPPKPRPSPGKVAAAIAALFVLFALAGGVCLMSQRMFSFGGPEEDGPPVQTGAEQGGSSSSAAGSGAHNEVGPGHVDQSWKPTYVKVGDWEIALARQQVVTEDYTPDAGNAKDGSTFVMVSLFVVNKGPAEAELPASCFAAEAAGATYGLCGYTTQEARPGNPVAFEGAFEVPRDTRGLVVTFTPPEGGATARLPLPEVLY